MNVKRLGFFLLVFMVASCIATGATPALAASTGEVKGHLTYGVAGAPLWAGGAYASLSVRQPCGAWVPSQWWAYTDAMGDYDIQGVPPGTYRMEFFGYGRLLAFQGYSDKLTAGAGDDIVVAAGQTLSGINAAFAPASFITGHVTDKATGQPVSGVVVGAHVNDGTGWWPDESRSAACVTDASGSFEVDGLAAGTYHLSIWPPDGNHLPQFYNDVSGNVYGVASSGDDVVVGEGETVAGIDASLTPAAHIDGRVTDKATGAPLQNVNIRLFTRDGSGAWIDRGVAGSTDASGNYDCAGLTANTYRLRFEPGDSHFAEAYDSKPSIEAADNIVVAEGQTLSGIDVALSGPASTFVRLSGNRSGKVNKAFRLSGSAGPSGAKGIVKIFLDRFVGNKWTPYGSGNATVSHGRFAWNFKPKYKGKWRFRANYRTAVRTYAWSWSNGYVNAIVK